MDMTEKFLVFVAVDEGFRCQSFSELLPSVAAESRREPDGEGKPDYKE